MEQFCYLLQIRYIIKLCYYYSHISIWGKMDFKNLPRSKFKCNFHYNSIITHLYFGKVPNCRVDRF